MLRKLRTELEEDRRERQETREFMREMNIRYERSFQIVAKRLENQGAELKDMGDQIRANTAATWAMVDEIRGHSS